MKKIIITMLSLIIYSGLNAQIGYGYRETASPFRWAENTPADCPFPADQQLDNILFSGRYQNYTNADTWYPSWADDGNLYSPWTDGYLLNVEEFEPFCQWHPGHACNSLDYMGRKAATAQAKIVGDDPMNLQIIDLKPRIEASGEPRFRGRYPSATLVKDGIWYYGTYCLEQDGPCSGVGWTKLGPFVGFRISVDYGKTWTETTLTSDNPLFGEDPDKAPVKIGAPHFVDFGKNMEHSPDGKAYLVGHGSTNPDVCNNWIQGDQVYLCRVNPSLENINDESKWEYYGGKDKNGNAVWTEDFEEIKPLLEWAEQLGCVTITYNAPLRKYLMCITRGISSYQDEEKKGWVDLRYDSMILAADEIDGDWKLVQYLDHFGPVAYFLNIPSKFISEDGKKMWLIYSANWMDKNMIGNPPGSYYSLSMHEIEIVLHGE
jgi:hypothetical protein